MNAAPAATQRRGQVILMTAGENVSDEPEISIGTPCQVRGHCGALVFKAEKRLTIHNCCSFP
jgi:hypothetical protein